MKLDTVQRALSTGGLSLIIKDYDKEDKVVYESNRCKCCGQVAQHYGTGWMGTGGSGSCTREVCVLCLEGGCKCCGSDLKRPAAEIHDNCQHDKRSK